MAAMKRDAEHYSRQVTFILMSVDNGGIFLLFFIPVK